MANLAGQLGLDGVPGGRARPPGFRGTDADGVPTHRPVREHPVISALATAGRR